MTYLFLAVPPFCGSTVLHNYIAKCANVAQLTSEMRRANSTDAVGIIEGNAATKARTLYGDVGEDYIRIIPGVYVDTIQDADHYSWEKIKAFLDTNWKESKPDASIRLQKTPNDVYRIPMMQPYFDALWIIMTRNPYAYTESIIEKLLLRRISPNDKLPLILEHVVNTYRIQKENQAFLGDKAYTMTFEDFVANEDMHTAGLKAWMPELSDLTFKGECRVKQETVTGLTNNNAQRIELLKGIPGAMDKVNAYFAQHKDALKLWGYELI